MDEQRSTAEQVADVLFYAPVGLALEARRLLPEMAERGRRQVTFNWMVGRYAVRRARARTDEVVGLVTETAGGLVDLTGLRLPGAAPSEDPPGSPGADTTAAGASASPAGPTAADTASGHGSSNGSSNGSHEPGSASGSTSRGAGDEAEAPQVPAPDPDELAIPGYDSLSAFQVVPRLEGLGGDELEAVRQYEHATRGRRTILSRIAQLQQAS